MGGFKVIPLNSYERGGARSHSECQEYTEGDLVYHILEGECIIIKKSEIVGGAYWVSPLSGVSDCVVSGENCTIIERKQH